MRPEEIGDLEGHEEALGVLWAALEDAFWIELAPEDLPVGSTYRDVFERLKSKLGDMGSPACLTSVAFYRLRGELARMSGRDKKQIRPGTLMADLFPWRTRRAVWHQLDMATRLRLPELVPGPWVNAVHFFAPILLSLLVATPLGSTLLCMAGWIAFGLFGRPLHRTVPGRLWTVGDFTRSVAGLNHAKLYREAGGTTEKQLRRAFQEVVAEIEGADPNTVELDDPAIVGV